MGMHEMILNRLNVLERLVSEIRDRCLPDKPDPPKLELWHPDIEIFVERGEIEYEGRLAPGDIIRLGEAIYLLCHPVKEYPHIWRGIELMWEENAGGFSAYVSEDGQYCTIDLSPYIN